MDKLLPRIPFADWIDNGVDWLVTKFSTVFDGIAVLLETIVEGSVDAMALIPSILLAIIFALLAWWIASRNIGIFTLVGFLFIDYLGYW